MAEGASVEQHVLTCERCRARVNTAAVAADLTVVDLDAVWDRTRDAVEVPRPSFFERLLGAAGLPPTRPGWSRWPARSAACG